MTVQDLNVTTKSQPDRWIFETYKVGLISLTLSVIIICTIVGNILVIVSIITQRALQTVQNYFIVSLAAADLTVAVFVLPICVYYYLIGYWSMSFIACDLWRTLDVCLCTASILNICAIALDRYWAITDSINYAGKRTRPRVLTAIALVWIVSVLVSVPPLFWLDDHERDSYDNLQETQCNLSDEKVYIVLSAMSSFFLPFLLMAVVYMRIYWAARLSLRSKITTNKFRKDYAVALKECETNFTVSIRTNYSGLGSPRQFKPKRSEKREHFHASKGTNLSKSHELHSFESLVVLDEKERAQVEESKPGNVWSLIDKHKQQQHRINMKKERKAARTLGVIVGCFSICWFPFFLMYVILPFCSTCSVSPQLVQFITWVGYINSMLNPIIYTIFNRDFRNAFTKILFGRCKHSRDSRDSTKQIRFNCH
ncbi:probable G-protein coupled receptor No18 [Anneissia japonica]|uniref:probable G-protein coupled receptor No18 n=1 Tax=Anneissia japonica TaxID=1529436 RepID=UPI0014259337|nr:probable G-protein coupled receptor No18 [Anneissia japonica]